MAKYDNQLGDLKKQLSEAQNVLVTLPAQFSTDELAASLALALALQSAKKQVTIATEGTIKVSDSNLFGVGQISKSLPPIGAGNLILSLEGVVSPDGSVPALEKLDWYPEGGNLNLVFHVLPGQKFEPSKIVPKVQSGGFNLIFVVGAPNLEALGGIYSSNKQAFEGVTVINIDNDPSNSNFGKINVIDRDIPSVSAMFSQLLHTLNLPIDGDTASNILAGIYSATANLTANTKPDTFMAVGYMMQSGGKLPAPLGVESVPQPQTAYQPPAQPQPQPDQTPTPAQPEQPVSQPQVQNPQPQQPVQGGEPMVPLNQIFGFPVQGEETAAAPQPNDNQASNANIPTPSQEEAPQGEQAYSSNPEVQNPDPDWLTPKVYKGSNLG